MRYTEIAWDFDGTLYCSYPHLVRAMQKAIRMFGYDAEEEEINRYFRINTGVVLRHYAPLCGCTPEQLFFWYKKQDRENMDDVTLYPGIKDLLKDIVAAGGRNHLCTNRAAAEAEQYLIRDGIREYFDCISGMTPGSKPKPAPDLVVRILEHTGASPDQLIMIGDRELDHSAAHAASCAGCFFDPDGYLQDRPQTEYFAPSLEALRRIILTESLNGRSPHTME